MIYAGKGKEDANIQEDGLANPNGQGTGDLQGPSGEVGGLLSSCQISWLILQFLLACH